MVEEQGKSELRLFGLLSPGDLIALAGVAAMGGAMWFQVNLMAAEQEHMGGRISALEQVIPSEYVRRQDYREDVKEIKDLLRRIEVKVDTKQDRPLR